MADASPIASTPPLGDVQSESSDAIHPTIRIPPDSPAATLVGTADHFRTPPSPSTEKLVVIDFAKNDPENPYNWTGMKKFRVLFIACCFSMQSSGQQTAYIQGLHSMMRELHCSRLAVTSGQTSSMIVAALAPLILAPVSEQWGRRPMLLISVVFFMLTYLPHALLPNIAGIVVFRGVQGVAASGANSLVGGLVADVLYAHNRGFAMGLFSYAIYLGTYLGSIVFSFVEVYLGYHWIAWILMMVSGVSVVSVYFLLDETRGSTILEQRARRLTKETGVLHVASTEVLTSKASVWATLKLTLTRPILFLCTEPIVTAFSVWLGLLWSLVFLFADGIGIIFQSVYGFGTIATGLVFISPLVGVTISLLGLEYVQEKLYLRAAKRAPHGRAAPEARLYSPMVGGIIIPIALFIFAFTARKSVHWIVPTLALGLFEFGTFPAYIAGYSFLSDAYEQYASSAIAAQSFARNLLGGIFPLLVESLYTNLGFQNAGILLACLALFFAPVPILVFRLGPYFRSRSRVAKQILAQQEKRAAEHEEETRVEHTILDKEPA